MCWRVVIGDVDDIDVSGDCAIGVLVEVVGIVGGGAEVLSMVIATGLGAGAVADFIEAVFELLACHRSSIFCRRSPGQERRSNTLN